MADENSLVGETFGRLTVEEKAGRGPRGVSWWCRCTCDRRVRLCTFKLLEDGYESCGCARKKSDRRQPVPTGLRKLHPLTVRSWEAMLARCHYATEKQRCYREVVICDEWYSFENFLRDVGPRPSIRHSLDREDPDKGYNKDNCRWLTKTENSSRIRGDYSPERNARVSAGVKRAHRLGLILTPAARVKIAAGAAKRVGRRLGACPGCGGKTYLPRCTRCQGLRK